MFNQLARSELLSTFFPTWIWQGRMWSKLRIPKYDPYYWINAHAHPVISTYYPLAIASSIIGQAIELDMAFLLFVSMLIFHILGAFVGWFLLVKGFAGSLVALFGAITFTLAGYNWKQQPCFQYTIAWFPWLLYGIATSNQWLAGISLGGIILAGYYPIGIQCLGIALLAFLHWHTSLAWIPIGLLIGAVQLIPFLRYLPKTIRANQHDDIGKVPLWHFGSLLFPKTFRYYINGVGFWEMSYYVGIIPLFTVSYTHSYASVLLILSLIIMTGAFSKWLPRIPARWSFTFQWALIWCALDGLNRLCLPANVIAILILIQTFDLLLNNKDLLITRPYSELYEKPSWAFDNRLTRYLKENLEEDSRVSGLPYPLFTGHINKFKTLGYSGGMQLKLMAKWRNDTNPNGSGDHDYFRRNNDDSKLDTYRVAYAWTNKKLNWPSTPIKNLWANPRLKTNRE